MSVDICCTDILVYVC